MAWEALSDEEKDILREYIAVFSEILDEVADYCQLNGVAIVKPSTAARLSVAYSKMGNAAMAVNRTEEPG